MPDHRTWHEIRELHRRVTDLGAPFVLTDEIRALLTVTASDVAIAPQDVAQALQDDASASALLKEIAKRIRVGSRRLSRAITESTQRHQEGDLEGARAPFRELLTVEVVPFYRELAQVQLDALDEP